MRLAMIPVVLAVAACGNTQKPEAVQVDHIVLGISDLQAGIDTLEELTGVRPVFGGEHPDLGTHNALMSLGTGLYLEILAPRPDAEVVDWLLFLNELSTLTPVMWAIATSDAARTADRLATNGSPTTEVVPGSRTVPDGSILEWKTFRFSDLVEHHFLSNGANSLVIPPRTHQADADLIQLNSSTRNLIGCRGRSSFLA